MYKVASDRRQRVLHRGRLADWQNGTEVLSPEDRIKQLQDGAKILEERILAIPGKKDPERRRLGREKAELQAELHELKRVHKLSIPRDWKLFFVDEAKRILSDSQFQMVYRAAIIASERRAGLADALMDQETE